MTTNPAIGSIVALVDADGDPTVGIVAAVREDERGIDWWTVIDETETEYEVDCTTVPVIDEERVAALRELLRRGAA